MNTITLWQVKLDQQLAFFDKSIVEITTDGEEIEVPYCHRLMQTMLIWRQQWIPILRLHPNHKTLVVVHTNSHTDCPYLALAVDESPSKVLVSDEDFLKEDAEFLPAWQMSAISAVDINGVATPILHPGKFLEPLWIGELEKQLATTSHSLIDTSFSLN